MYPFFRLAKELYLNRQRPPMPLADTHVIHLRVRPWDIDPFLELNNGPAVAIWRTCGSEVEGLVWHGGGQRGALPTPDHSVSKA